MDPRWFSEQGAKQRKYFTTLGCPPGPKNASKIDSKRRLHGQRNGEESRHVIPRILQTCCNPMRHFEVSLPSWGILGGRLEVS